MDDAETLPIADPICAYCAGTSRVMVGDISTCGVQVCMRAAQRENRLPLSTLLDRHLARKADEDA